MTNSQPLKFETPDQGEETARADLYGLLASLFYAPPSQALLDTLAMAPAGGDAALQHGWRGLVEACRALPVQVISDEYEALFIGVGRPEIFLYGSYYLSGFLMEKPLIALRDDLTQLGLQKADSVIESEDHIATLCEVMRYLIASDDVLQASLTTQKNFFAAHLQPWVQELCTAVENHPQAKFYAAAALLTRNFFDIEMQAFDME